MDTRQFPGMVSTEKAMILDIALMNLFSSHHGTGRTWRFMKYDHVSTFYNLRSLADDRSKLYGITPRTLQRDTLLLFVIHIWPRLRR